MMSALTTSIQHSTGDSRQCNQARTVNKRYAGLKKKVKLFLFTEDMTTYIEKQWIY